MHKIAVLTPVGHLFGITDFLEELGEVYYIDLYSKEEVRQKLLDTDANIIVCNPNRQSYIIDEELLKGTQVKVINTCSTGLNHIDITYCEKNDILIQHHKNDMKLLNELPSTAELAFGLLLDLARNITLSSNHVKKGGWDYTRWIGHTIKGMNVGIVGYGRLGKMMFNYCEAFGANVKIYDPYVRNTLSDAFLLNNWSSSLEGLFEWSDAVSLHVHASEETDKLINKKLLQKCSVGLLVNTSRGSIVDEEDIANALQEGYLSGYGADVLADEYEEVRWSPLKELMILSDHNIVITPHVGGMTWEGQQKAYEWSLNKLKDIK